MVCLSIAQWCGCNLRFTTHTGMGGRKVGCAAGAAQSEPPHPVCSFSRSLGAAGIALWCIWLATLTLRPRPKPLRFCSLFAMVALARPIILSLSCLWLCLWHLPLSGFHALWTLGNGIYFVFSLGPALQVLPPSLHPTMGEPKRDFADHFKLHIWPFLFQIQLQYNLTYFAEWDSHCLPWRAIAVWAPFVFNAISLYERLERRTVLDLSD